MAETTYTYSRANDFPDENVLALDRLKYDVEQAGFSANLLRIEAELNPPSDSVKIVFGTALSTEEQTQLDTVVSTHSGIPMPSSIEEVRIAEQKDEKGLLKFVPEVRSGTELIVATHNFCDPCSWYTESARITGEQLTELDPYTFSGNNTHWIDLYHGKVMHEDRIIVQQPHMYTINVYVDGYQLVHDLYPFDQAGGDYTVNYTDGYVIFKEDMSGKQVFCDYSYARGSEWRFEPYPGKTVIVESAEAQFSSDVVYNDIIEFDAWAYNPYDFPNKVLVGRSSYKHMYNFIDEAQGVYPILPPLGGELGTKNPTYGFPFRYGTSRPLQSSLGLDLRVRLKHNNTFGGERVTSTFYCTVVDDV